MVVPSFFMPSRRALKSGGKAAAPASVRRRKGSALTTTAFARTSRPSPVTMPAAALPSSRMLHGGGGGAMEALVAGGAVGWERLAGPPGQPAPQPAQAGRGGGRRVWPHQQRRGRRMGHALPTASSGASPRPTQARPPAGGLAGVDAGSRVARCRRQALRHHAHAALHHHPGAVRAWQAAHVVHQEVHACAGRVPAAVEPTEAVGGLEGQGRRHGEDGRALGEVEKTARWRHSRGAQLRRCAASQTR